MAWAFLGVLSRHSKVNQLGFGTGGGKRLSPCLFLCVYKNYDVRELWVGVTFFLPKSRRLLLRDCYALVVLLSV